MIRPKGNVWKISAISELNNFLSRNTWTTMNRSVMKAKVRKPVTYKWVFKSKEDPDGLIHLKSINLVNGYLQVPGVDFTDLFSPAASDTSTRILIGMTLYHEENGGVAEICDMEVSFLHSNMEVEIFI